MSGSGGGLGRRFREVYFASPLHAWRISGNAPTDLAVPLGDAWPGDSEAGRGILEGLFPVPGQSVQAGGDPWGRDDLVPETMAALQRFEWLRDLRDLGGDAARLRARDLVAGWIDRYRGWDRLAWRPDVLGTRLAAWIGTFSFFAESADDEFRASLLESLARQHRHLVGALSSAPAGLPRLEALKGAILGAVALGQPDAKLDPLLEALTATLSVQVLADGGHVSRAPHNQVQVLVSLVDIRAALRAAGRNDTATLDDPIQRMTGILRMLRHGDGGLALFNGATEDAVWRTDALLARSESKAKAAFSAPESGFERLIAGRMLVIVDTGSPPAGDDRAHAGTLSFELSIGKERLVVNCGSSPAESRWRTPLRATAAHSTLVIDDTNSCEIRVDGCIGRRPAPPKVERTDAEGSVWLEAEHDGYDRTYGLAHRRRFYLASGGDDLRGEDVLSYTGAPGSKPQVAAIRFHLHPRVSASLVQSGEAVLLRTAGGSGWRFRTTAPGLSLVDSVYFGAGGQMQRTRQILLEVPVDTIREDGSIGVKWAFRREERRNGARGGGR